MSPPLKIAKLTPNGEIRTADLLTSIAKRLRLLSCGSREVSGQNLKTYARQIEKLAKALEAQP